MWCSLPKFGIVQDYYNVLKTLTTFEILFQFRSKLLGHGAVEHKVHKLETCNILCSRWGEYNAQSGTKLAKACDAQNSTCLLHLHT